MLKGLIRREADTVWHTDVVREILTKGVRVVEGFVDEFAGEVVGTEGLVGLEVVHYFAY